MGFARLQNSVYITVHDVIDNAKALAKSLGVSEQVKVMLVEDLGISDQRKLAEKLWNLEKLNKKYREFIKRNKNGYKGEGFTSSLLRYWLKKTRYEYLSILHEDPVLPKELLPANWMGNEAQKIWEQMERILETY
jgi:phenylacetic acid degradation operon negative regulatory protein